MSITTHTTPIDAFLARRQQPDPRQLDLASSNDQTLSGDLKVQPVCFEIANSPANSLHDPVTLSLSTDHVHVTDVIHVQCSIEPGEKDHSLVRILEVENPTAPASMASRTIAAMLAMSSGVAGSLRAPRSPMA